MSSGDVAASQFGEALAKLIILVFSLLFPFTMITLCGLSYLLSTVMDAPELSIWASVASAAFWFALAHIWAAIGLIVFTVGAFPLVWVAYRELEIKVSKALGSVVIAVIGFGLMFWLRTIWPNDGLRIQAIVFGVLMFIGWSALVEGVLMALAIRGHVRRNRVPPVSPPKQQPHGPTKAPGPSKEPETI